MGGAGASVTAAVVVAIFGSAVNLENGNVADTAVDIISVFRYANGFGAEGSAYVDKSSVISFVNSSANSSAVNDSETTCWTIVDTIVVSGVGIVFRKAFGLGADVCRALMRIADVAT